MTVAWTKADCAAFDSLHWPFAGSVAVSRYGVASPLALSGSAGTIRVQSGFGSASCPPPVGEGHELGSSDGLGSALGSALVVDGLSVGDEPSVGDELPVG